MAVMQSKIQYIEDSLHEIVDTTKEQQKIVQNILLTAQIMQSNHESLDKAVKADIQPKVEEMYKNRSQISGAWTTFRVLGSVIVVCAAVVEIVKMLHP